MDIGVINNNFSYIKGAVVGGIHVKGFVSLPSRTLLKANTKTANMKSKEIWKSIPIDNPYYMASNWGNIKSIDRYLYNSLGRKCFYPSTIIKPCKKKDGYLYVGIALNGTTISTSVHTLVAKTFHGQPSEGLHVNHINGIKTDNRASNLEYCTFRENILHGYRIGLIDKRGENHHTNKLNNQQVLEIRRLAADGNLTNAQIGDMFGVTGPLVSLIKNRKIWRHL